MSITASNQTHSSFVTVLGWMLICFTVLGVVTSLMQNVMVNFIMIPTFSKQTAGVGSMPDFAAGAFRGLAAFMLIVTASLLYASWSFLKRRNWARRAFVVFFTLGALWGTFVFLGFGIGVGLLNLMPQLPASPDNPPEVNGILRVMGIMFGVFSGGVAVLFYWLIRRIRSAEVRAEFKHDAAVL